MKLFEISPNDTLTQNCVALVSEKASILKYAEFYGIIGNSDMPRKNATASGGQFRALNDNYAANTVNPQYGQVNLKIFGDKIMVDKAHERRGKDIASERLRQLDGFCENLGRNIQFEFFNGNVNLNNKSWNGLSTIIPSSQIIYGSDEGLVIPLGNSDAAKTAQQQFIEKMRNLISKIDGKPDVIYMNEDVYSRLTSIASEYLVWQKDEFGILMPFFAGIPLEAGGYTSSGSLIIPANEMIGEYSNASTITALKFGEEKDLTIGTSTGLVVSDEGLVGNHYIHSVELDADIALLNTKAVAQLKGIVLQ